VLALVAGADQPRLLRFAARQDGWALSASEPVLTLENAWQELFPELADPLPDQLRQAWQAWALPRGLSQSQADACTLTLADNRLHVQAPSAVTDHLRATRSDVFKGDTWLLLGDGRVRKAVNLVLGERGA
jgi:hypothetical protein